MLKTMYLRKIDFHFIFIIHNSTSQKLAGELPFLFHF